MILIPKNWRDAVCRILESFEASRIVVTHRAKSDWEATFPSSFFFEMYSVLADAMKDDKLEGNRIYGMTPPGEVYEFFFMHQGRKLYGKINLLPDGKIIIILFCTCPIERRNAMTIQECKDFGWEAITKAEEVIIPNSDGSVRERIPVEVTAFRDSDGEIYLPGESLERMDRIKARYMGIILPSQLKEFRSRSHKTQEEMCEILGLGKRTWTRWETGAERPSRSLSKLLGVLWAGRLSLNDLDVDLSVENDKELLEG